MAVDCVPMYYSYLFANTPLRRGKLNIATTRVNFQIFLYFEIECLGDLQVEYSDLATMYLNNDYSPAYKSKNIVIINYHRLWLISACAYSGKWNDSMRLIKDMCL